MRSLRSARNDRFGRIMGGRCESGMVERDLHVDARADDAPWIREVTSTSASTEQARPRLSALLPIAAIRLRIPAMDWRAAVRASGEALVAAGITTPAYTDQMIATVEALGPYIVLAPVIASPEGAWRSPGREIACHPANLGSEFAGTPAMLRASQ